MKNHEDEGEEEDFGWPVVVRQGVGGTTACVRWSVWYNGLVATGS